MEVKNIDLENGIVNIRSPRPRRSKCRSATSWSSCCAIGSRTTPRSSARIVDGCFPSVTAASGHLEEEKLTASEPKLFKAALVAAHAAA